MLGELAEDMGDQRLAVQVAQRFVAAAHPAGKPACEDNSCYLFHLEAFIAGALAEVARILVLDGAHILVIKDAVFA